MGKRKYDNDNQNSPNEVKKDESTDQKDTEDDSEQPQRNPSDSGKRQKRANIGGFDIKHFRKELAAKQGQTMVLTQFLQVCLNPDNEYDYLLEYLKSGGNSHEILRQINQDSKKNLTLTTPAFHIFHLIILKVQSSMPHMITITEEACRYFLNNFMSTVEIMISENSGPRHRKIILKLLTSMVTLNTDLGIEVLSHAPLTPKHLQYIVEKTNYKEKDNVRTTFVHFMTSFLIDGHLPLIKALLEKQGLLALVIPGLVQDDAEAVLMFLNILKKNVIENALISKSLKLRTFSHQVLHNIFKIFSWKGPPEITQHDRNEMRSEIVNLLTDIIFTLFTSHKLGLYFIDNTFGTTDVNKNQNLYKALLTLKRPWENVHEGEVIIQIVHKCPDLHRAVMNIVEQSFEPQHSPIWERTVEFVIRLLDKMKPENVVLRMSKLNASQTVNFIRFVSLPVPLLKFIHTNLGKDSTISVYCVKVLVKMLQTLKRYMEILEMDDSSARLTDLRNKLEHFLPKHLPIPTVIVSLIQDIVSDRDVADDKVQKQDYKLPKIEETCSLIYLTDLLLLYNDIHPAFFEILEGNIDMKQLLNFSSTLKSGNVALLKFKVVSLWLTLDRSALSLNNSMFKDLFLIMLEVYTSDEGDTWVEAKTTLHNFFKSTSIFEGDEDEIHLVLYSLRNSSINPVSLIADVIEYVLKNNKELTEYVRNQIIHFEISDEGSEACLDKLFNDLMDNRSTEDSVFLQNKIPSIFIVGCMQYMHTNKEAKKNLKNFFSSYITNLFHCNYSPELTEVLIGDLKLDVRSYITSWVTQAIALSENLVAKDNTLRNISRAIIDKEGLSIKEIFPCIEESLKEEADLTLPEGTFKVNSSLYIDSSDLLIWAKYLIFCVVRLTNINQLEEAQQNIITNYFHCLITIGKKMHLMNYCRVAVLSLFKNPHNLKIYKPLKLKDDDGGILATQFLLDVIRLHPDIVSHLDKKHKILKSYQQKNYRELVKAFIKINKRKNLSSGHTVKVLEIIGMSNEDDFIIFNKIFGFEAIHFVKDDKDPSFVLDVLQILVDKYSKSVTNDTPEHVIRKSVKLYTELLTNKDINANLTNLECTLTQYFENKPHHSAFVNDDSFKKFFSAVTIRKSTSQLAAILLKYNLKLCNVFKEQLNRPEILSQRELTLPLGNASLNHKHFLIENKELLNKVYEEYKSNIYKMLEKPHKIGQVYNACWKFVRKLVIECMDIKDCQKLFTKSYKYEVAEICHINLLETVFIKTYLNEKDYEIEYFINCLLSLLHIATIALKENKETEMLKEIVKSVNNVILLSESMNTLNGDVSGEYKKVIESAVWQNFCKTVMKDSLKIKTAVDSNTAGPELLFLLTKLVTVLYKTDHEDIITLFDMVTSHSEFLNVMLSHHSSDIKSRLVEFLYTLIKLNKNVMKSQQIPVYLSAYHATRNPCDRLILAILHFYESNGQPVNEYKPYVFGDSAANHYAVRKSRSSSLWGHPTPNRLLNLFDKDVIDRTVRHFPVTQTFKYHYELTPPTNICISIKNVLQNISKEGVFKVKAVKDNETIIKNLLVKAKYEKTLDTNADIVVVSHLDEDCGIYDPVFLFPLLSHLLAPGSVASCFKLMRTGLLSVPVMALSSQCPMMRASAYHVLHRFCMLLETETRHKNDKLFLTDFINTLRMSLTTVINNSVDNGESHPKNPRLPVIGALYLARALMVSTAPSDPMYKPVNHFFIAKQLVDFTVVPDFLTLFHDCDVEAVDRRLWILDIIRDGTKTMADINVVFKTMCLKMIMDFYSSVLCDKKVKKRILGMLHAVIAVPRALEILVEGYGFFSWLHFIIRQLTKDDKGLVKSMFSIMETIINSVTINSYARNIVNSKNGNKFNELKINKDVENEVLNILYELLQHIDGLDVEGVNIYVKIYNLLTRRAIKNLTKKQILTLVSKIGTTFKDSETTKLLTNAIISNDSTILQSKFIVGDISLQTKDDLFNELVTITNVYIL